LDLLFAVSAFRPWQSGPHSADSVVAIRHNRLSDAGIPARIGIVDRPRHQRARLKDCTSAASLSSGRASQTACSAVDRSTASKPNRRWSAARS